MFRVDVQEPDRAAVGFVVVPPVLLVNLDVPAGQVGDVRDEGGEDVTVPGEFLGNLARGALPGVDGVDGGGPCGMGEGTSGAAFPTSNLDDPAGEVAGLFCSPRQGPLRLHRKPLFNERHCFSPRATPSTNGTLISGTSVTSDASARSTGRYQPCGA
jgi:hypothetical protein